jgi:hypothetical protein
MLDWTSKYGNIPSPSTRRRKIMPAIRDYSYTRSVVFSLRTKNNEPTADSPLDAKKYASEGRVRLVFPSKWAPLDCRTGLLFESIVEERSGIRALPGFKLLFCDVEETPIEQNRRQFIESSSQIFVHSSLKAAHSRRSDFLYR